MTYASQYIRGAGLPLGFGLSGAMFLAVVGSAKNPGETLSSTTDASPTTKTTTETTTYATQVT